MQARELSKEAGPGLLIDEGYQWPVTGSYTVLTKVEGRIWASCLKETALGTCLGDNCFCSPFSTYTPTYNLSLGPSFIHNRAFDVLRTLMENFKEW